MSALMNRRQWLKTGTLAAVGVSVRPNASVLASVAPRPFDKPIRLHSNENPYGPCASARQAMQAAFDEGCRYPGGSYGELREMIDRQEGLTPEHVAEVVRTARPWGVDVSSGVETERKKDPTKVGRFIHEARRAALIAAP